MQTDAIGQFKKGLYVEGITEREALSLYFELGQAYERLSDPREALYYYEKVHQARSALPRRGEARDGAARRERRRRKRSPRRATTTSTPRSIRCSAKTPSSLEIAAS